MRLLALSLVPLLLTIVPFQSRALSCLGIAPFVAQARRADLVVAVRVEEVTGDVIRARVVRGFGGPAAAPEEVKIVRGHWDGFSDRPAGEVVPGTRWVVALGAAADGWTALGGCGVGLLPVGDDGKARGSITRCKRPRVIETGEGPTLTNETERASLDDLAVLIASDEVEHCGRTTGFPPEPPPANAVARPITGLVLDRNGKPLAGETCIFRGANGWAATVTTDEAGRLAVANVPPVAELWSCERAQVSLVPIPHEVKHLRIVQEPQN